MTQMILNLTPEERAQARALARFRVPPQAYCPQYPHYVQQAFLALDDREAFYGGAAGGAKSSALLMAALQYIDVPHYSALILRRTYTDLQLPGALMERAEQWLGDTDAKPQQGGKKWIFPSGAVLQFGSLQYESDLGQYKSSEYQYIAFDELTEFAERPYRFMFSRLRGPAISCMHCGVLLRKVAPGKRIAGGDEIAGPSGWLHRPKQTNYHDHCSQPRPEPAVMRYYKPAPDGMTLFDVPLRMRAASNPGGPGHAWVRDRFVTPASRVKSSAFIPARITDNPSLDQESYMNSLALLSEVDRLRLLEGRWDVMEEGRFFDRTWFKVLPRQAVPAGARIVRYWDLAATEAKRGADPDWSVGCLMAIKDGYAWIMDVVRVRGNPGDVEEVITNVTSQDPPDTLIRMEQEPGASGKGMIDHYRRHVFLGRAFEGVRPTGAKDVRARPLASAASAGNVALVQGSWNAAFLDELAAFPTTGVHDDQVDAASGAFYALTLGPQRRKARLIA